MLQFISCLPGYPCRQGWSLAALGVQRLRAAIPADDLPCSAPGAAHGAASAEPYLKQEKMPMAKNRAARDVE